MKSRGAKSQRREERRSGKIKNQKTEDAGAQKARKVEKHCVLPMICGSGGSESRLAKARKSVRRCGAKHISKSKSQNVQNMLGPLLEVEMSKKCTPVKRKAHFEVKRAKTEGGRSTFGRSDVALRSMRKGFCTLPKVRKT